LSGSIPAKDRNSSPLTASRRFLAHIKPLTKVIQRVFSRVQSGWGLKLITQPHLVSIYLNGAVRNFLSADAALHYSKQKLTYEDEQFDFGFM
jgi:hypothetical protein